MKFLASSLFLVTLFLSSCTTVGPDYARPDVALPEAYVEAPAETRQARDDAWWKSLNDPVLNELVDTALSKNYDVREAIGRLEESQARLGGARAEYAPEGVIEGNATRAWHEGIDARSGASEWVGSNQFQLRVLGSWEIDLRGRIRRLIEAADADEGALRAALADVQRLVAAQVVREYLYVRGAQQERIVTERNRDIQAEAVTLTNSLVEAGLNSEADVALARALLIETKARLPLLTAVEDEGIHRLALLSVGDPAAIRKALAAEPGLPDLPGIPEVGLPADLLRARPDIVAAERELAAATARIGVATADLYPSISLTGDYATSTTDLKNLFSASNASFGVGPSIRWPLFNFGRIRAEIEAQGAREQQALANFERRVSTSIMEVEIALSALRQRALHREGLSDALAEYENALSLVDTRYREGVVSFLDVLDAQRSVLTVETARTQADSARLQAFVDLNAALGFGMDPTIATAS